MTDERPPPLPDDVSGHLAHVALAPRVTLTVTTRPRSLVPLGDWTVHVRATAEVGVPTGTATVVDAHGRTAGAAALVDGRASIELHPDVAGTVVVRLGALEQPVTLPVR